MEVIHGDLAQLVEHLLCKQGVRGSSPLVSTMEKDPSELAGLFHLTGKSQSGCLRLKTATKQQESAVCDCYRSKPEL